MAIKKTETRRRSLNDRLDAELASAESIPVAGINNETTQPASIVTQKQQPVTYSPQQDRGEASQVAQAESVVKTLVTKKATTIMPKEVFAALQHYCTDTDTPKHRAIYLFLIEGLHAKGTITEEQYREYRDMASQLSTTYEKK